MTTAGHYEGLLRVLDRNGWLLDVGPGAASTEDAALGSWSGWMEVASGSCLAGKSLTVLVEFADGSRALAQVGPGSGRREADRVRLAVVGIDPAPY